VTIENNEWLWPNPGGFRVSVPRARADHEETKVLHGLARLLQKIGELGEEAEGMYRRALAIGEATHGPDDVQTGKIARGLARLILKRKR
jgi:hypothetical protein